MVPEKISYHYLIDTIKTKYEEQKQLERKEASVQQLHNKIRLLDAQIKDRQQQVNELEDKKSIWDKNRLQTENEYHGKANRHDQRLKEICALDAWLANNKRFEWLNENFSALSARIERLAVIREEYKIQKRRFDKLAAKLAALNEEMKVGNSNKDVAQKMKIKIEAQIAEAEKELEIILAAQTLEDIEKSLEQCMIERTKAESLKSLDERRRELIAGEPCPLCGAIHHPYASAELPNPVELFNQWKGIDERMKKYRTNEKALQELKNSLAEIAREWDKHNDRLKQLGADQQEMEADRKEQAEVVRRLRDQGTREKEEIGELMKPYAEHGPSLEAQLARCDDKLNLWRERCKDLIKLKEREAEERIEVEKLRVSLETMKVERERQDRELSEHKEQLENQRAERRREFGEKVVEDEERLMKEGIQKVAREIEEGNTRLNAISKAIGQHEGVLKSCQAEAKKLQVEMQQNYEELLAILERLKVTFEEFEQCRKPLKEIASLENESKRLEEMEIALKKEKELNACALARETDKMRTTRTVEELVSEKALSEAELAKIQQGIGEILGQLKENEKRKEDTRELHKEVEKARKEYHRWSRLAMLIGSANGDKFRSIAQPITLEILLNHANIQLQRIMKRYQLKRGANLELEVIDGHQANEVRPVSNLSGGETFAASLALALGLSAMSGKGSFMGALFLDEGFGSLDGDTLDLALEAIGSIQQEGTIIGIISHVESLKEKIGAQIQIRPIAFGRSEIIGPGCRKIS